MRRARRFLLICAPALATWIQLGYRLGDTGLWSRGEGRAALVARNILDENDFVAPVLDASRTTKPMAVAMLAQLASDEVCAVIGRNEYSFAYPLRFDLGRCLAWFPDVDAFPAAIEPGTRLAVALRSVDEARLRSLPDLRVSDAVPLAAFRETEYRLVRIRRQPRDF